MHIAFRADASLQIGTGHVMRCLTLAKALSARGATCQFICRAHEGHLIDFIRSMGFVAYALPMVPAIAATSTYLATNSSCTDISRSDWLDATQAEDAKACIPILAAQRPDWLIVDHYALDTHWERTLAPHYGQLMVIDDLADRPHACNLLLDQTFGRDAADYRPLVPAECHLLCGSQYALLRPEFASLRPYSLQRRTQPVLRELLITMGGVDKDNVTGQLLRVLRTCCWPSDCRVTVVMGSTAPWLDEVKRLVKDMPWPTRVLVGVSDMAQLMADSDLAIGAAGATSWERCCLGLPTAMMVLAENQRHAARMLEQANAVRMLDLTIDFQKHLKAFINEIFASATCLAQLRDSASNVTDGQGCERVADWLMRREKE